MKLIKKEEVGQLVGGKYEFKFFLERDGTYLMEIIASAKSWSQNVKRGRAFFRDDDLFLFLDSRTIGSLAAKKKDAGAAWNGNDLKGRLKTLVIAAWLDKGEHKMYFEADYSPVLERICVFQPGSDDILYEPDEKNNPAQAGEGRPWVSLVAFGLAATQLSIKASAKAGKGRGDDGDLKAVVNGKIIKNTEGNTRHQDWHWCGRLLKGEEKILEVELDPLARQYTVDLYADGRPSLSFIRLEIKPDKRIPTVNNPLWTENFEDDTEEMLLARLIFGEAEGEPREAKIWVAWSVINRMEADSWWPKTIKEVILQAGQYDPFKPTNERYERIINPLGFDGANEATKESWYECYRVAKDVVERKIKNPTKATHFIGKGGIGMENFEKYVIPKGKFLKEIGNTRFYWSPN